MFISLSGVSVSVGIVYSSVSCGALRAAAKCET